MSAAFEFATAGRIVFGAGRLAEIGSIVSEFGRRVLLVTGSSPDRASVVRDRLVRSGCFVTAFAVAGEPTIALAETAARVAREADCDCVIGFGGGSVIDAAKAAAALATNCEPALAYLEVIGQGRPLVETPLPMIAIPTTAGTGAEVTRNAVLHSPEAGVKVSLRSALMLPRVALVDPETTISLPAEMTAATGMDALTQLIESFLTRRANPVTDALCREALPRIARSLRRVVEDGSDLAARVEVSFASLCSGITLANAGLGAVHGLAAPLGGRFGAPHGAVCAALLAPVLRANLRAASASESHQETLKRFAELASLVSEGTSREPEVLLKWISELAEALKIRGLGHFGLREEDFDELAAQSLAASSMKGNPVVLSSEVLATVLREAL